MATAAAAMRSASTWFVGTPCGVELVATATKGCAAREYPVAGPERWAAPRLAHAAVQFGESVLHIISVYSPCQSLEGGPRAVDACNRLVHQALGIAALLGQVPCVIVGDFNQDPMPHLATAECALSGWRDVAAALGVTTCPGGGREGRRIDRVFANSQAAQAIAAVRLRWDLGVAAHAAIEVVVRSEARPAYLLQGQARPSGRADQT